MAFGADCFQRDELYSSYAKTLSGKATRRKLHGELLEFLANQDSSFKYVDSTNGDAEGRSLYVESAQAHHVVLLNFCCDDVDFLMERTMERLGDNPAGHPFFPNSVREQQEKHVRILRGIRYADSNDDFADSTCTTTVMEHDPKAGDESLEQLAYRVFLAVLVGKRLLPHVGAFHLVGCTRSSSNL